MKENSTPDTFSEMKEQLHQLHTYIDTRVPDSQQMFLKRLKQEYSQKRSLDNVLWFVIAIILILISVSLHGRGFSLVIILTNWVVFIGCALLHIFLPNLLTAQRISCCSMTEIKELLLHEKRKKRLILGLAVVFAMVYCCMFACELYNLHANNAYIALVIGISLPLCFVSALLGFVLYNRKINRKIAEIEQMQ